MDSILLFKQFSALENFLGTFCQPCSEGKVVLEVSKLYSLGKNVDLHLR